MNRAELLNDNEEAMRLVLDGRQSCIWTAMPGIVQSVDFNAMTCEVQPAIQGTVEEENGVLRSVNLPLLINVPIVFPSAGGFLITFPIAQGDEVLVVFGSRCIDAWWQSGGIQRPMEARMHDLSDGFAIPGPKSLVRAQALGAISQTGAQIRNNAGTTYIEIAGDGKIKLVSPAGVHVTGDLAVSGDVVAGTVSLKNHTHGAGTLSNSGGPVTGSTGGPS